MTSARLAPLTTAVLALTAGCHLLAVPVASSSLRPAVSGRTPADLGLRYDERVLRGEGGIRMPAWIVAPASAGPSRGVVVLLAENGSNRAGARMLVLAAEVSRLGYEALLVDLRGHGNSSGVNTYGLGETRDLVAVLAWLRRASPGRPVFAVGFSLGAACILRAMSIDDTIRAAAVFAPYAALDRELIRHELRYQASQGGRPALARLVSPWLLGLALRAWAGFPRLPEPEDLVTNRPVVLFHCTGDPEIPFSNALRIADRAKAPLLDLRPVERSEHLPPLDDREVWDVFVAALREVLASGAGIPADG